ncbi:MAG: hypothetical protein MUC39_06395 [Candidatus Omnitrophica bacterium]|jgi:type II secretory pathway pseudopilin PulG|nr:hypothetical protein [Candidatus Omnitrophota bacterium]
MMKSLTKGFTLIEVLFTAGILAFTLCGLLLVYVNLFLLNDVSRKTTLAINAGQAKLEEIKNSTFDSLASSIFNVNGFDAANAKGIVEVTPVSPYTDLKKIRIIIAFRLKGEKIVGEDRNFNGIFDSGEDTMLVNNRLDSPVEIVTLISKE